MYLCKCVNVALCWVGLNICILQRGCLFVVGRIPYLFMWGWWAEGLFNNYVTESYLYAKFRWWISYVQDNCQPISVNISVNIFRRQTESRGGHCGAHADLCNTGTYGTPIQRSAQLHVYVIYWSIPEEIKNKHNTSLLLLLSFDHLRSSIEWEFSRYIFHHCFRQNILFLTSMYIMKLCPCPLFTQLLYIWII